jgi:hypothetical protein
MARQFEVDLGAGLLHRHAEGLPSLVPQAELFQLLQLAEGLFKALIERVEDLVKAQFGQIGAGSYGTTRLICRQNVTSN